MSEAPDARTIAATIRANLNLQRGEQLYTIVDACQDKELVFEAKTKFNQPIRSLFSGAGTESMADYAPYFIPIDLSNEYLERWCESWGKNAGIMIVSDAHSTALYRHMRDIFVVKDEKGQEYFFRFYDPRNLRVFLPNCDLRDLLTFLGPIRCLYCESDPSDKIISYQHTNTGLVENELAI